MNGDGVFVSFRWNSSLPKEWMEVMFIRRMCGHYGYDENASLELVKSNCMC